jgi:type I restriction enzyme R subunit
VHPVSENFAFLSRTDTQLARLGALAEWSFHVDPPTTIQKLRLFTELLVRFVAARQGALPLPNEPFADLLIRLQRSRVLPEKAANVCHHLRRLGNLATHENKGTAAQALSCLKLARELGLWLHRTFAPDPAFSPTSFVPPQPPRDISAELAAQIESLRTQLAASETAAASAARDAEEARRASETAAERAQREGEERALWEKLASEEESARIRVEAELRALQTANADKPPGERAELVLAAATAADRIIVDEADTRVLIDAQLVAAGWEADTLRLRYSLGTRPDRRRAIAIAEWPTETGPADYALFRDGLCLGIVEAKRSATTVPAALEQAKRYARGILLEPDQLALDAPFTHGLDETFRVPFVFATNARPYMRQLETQSGIWTWDARRATNRPSALPDWFSPRDLAERLEQEIAPSGFAEDPADLPGIRPYQRAAIAAIEAAIADGRREILVAMATGTGKTLTCIALMYRFLKLKRFRRILFLVDRTALGDQTETALDNAEVEGFLKFAQVYNVAGLDKRLPDAQDRVHVATVQSLARRILDDSDDRPSPGLYDLIVVDEAHRGYTLDAEMRESDLVFRDTVDYLSRYRRVLDHFDAVKIGLTATPALHTTQIFGAPVFHYSYRQAVLDGWLVDQAPTRRIVTALNTAGIHFEGGEEVEVLDPRTGQIDFFHTPDAIDFEVEQFNRRVLTRDFNRVVAEAIATEIPPTQPGKTLIFAVDRRHADILVDELGKALAAEHGPQPHDLVMRITGDVDRPVDKIRRFRNDARPRYAVTVDLLTTGIDIPLITDLVFVRRVNSRVLYDQMIGRATRLCPQIKKDTYRIFDAVDLYANLQSLTDMRPVVVDPKLTFADLLHDLARAAHDEDRRFVRDQIVAKLRARARRLTEPERDVLEQRLDRTLEAFADWAKEAAPQEVAAAFERSPRAVRLLDAPPGDRPREKTYISTHEDSLTAIEEVFGRSSTPEDYIESFVRFVKEHGNTLPGLVAATQRPRELTRKELKEAARQLDAAGFSEASLRRAYGRVRNADIAAHIIGFVRQAALGDPLVSYETRVDNALEKMLTKGTWSDKQRQWLRRIGRALKEMPVGDRETLEAPAFRQQGGFAAIDKVFDHKLAEVLQDMNEAIWSPPSAA